MEPNVTRHATGSAESGCRLRPFDASGVTVGAYCLWAVADWIHSQEIWAFGLFYLGAFSFVPTLLRWLAGGVHMFMASQESGRTPRGGADHRPLGVVASRDWY